MNVDVSLYGQSNNSLFQYPIASDKLDFFRQCLGVAKSETQVIFSRKGNLMYYSYVRKMGREDRLGFCFVLNGYVVNNIERLFSVFEEAFALLAVSGTIVKIADNGDVILNDSHQRIEQSDAHVVTTIIRDQLSNIQDAFSLLPSMDFGIQKELQKSFQITDDTRLFVDSYQRFDLTIIGKDVGYNAKTLNDRIEKNKSSQIIRIDENGLNIDSLDPPSGNSLELPPEPKSYLTESILCTLFCCLPLGIVALSSASKVVPYYRSGDYQGSLCASKKAKKYLVLAIWVEVSIFLLCFIIEFMAS